MSQRPQNAKRISFHRFFVIISDKFPKMPKYLAVEEDCDIIIIDNNLFIVLFCLCLMEGYPAVVGHGMIHNGVLLVSAAQGSEAHDHEAAA